MHVERKAGVDVVEVLPELTHGARVADGARRVRKPAQVRHSEGGLREFVARPIACFEISKLSTVVTEASLQEPLKSYRCNTDSYC